jgi:hypothetical protein
MKRVLLIFLILLVVASVSAQRVKSIAYSAGGTMMFDYSVGGVLPGVKYLAGKDTSVWKVNHNPLSIRIVYGKAIIIFDSIKRNDKGFIADMKMCNEQKKCSDVNCTYNADGYLTKFSCMYNTKQGIYTELIWNKGNLIKSMYYERNGDSLKNVGSMEFSYVGSVIKNNCNLYYPNQYLDIEIFNPLLYAGLMGMPPDSIPTSYLTTVGKTVTRSRISCWHDKQGRIDLINENSYYNGFNSKETITFKYE